MGVIHWTDVDMILSSVADGYVEYRENHGSPRSRVQIETMLDDVLRPMLDHLSSFQSSEGTAKDKLDRITEILGETS